MSSATDLGHGTPVCKCNDASCVDAHTLTQSFTDNPDIVEGAPCPIQVFTSGMRDEEYLAVAAVIDTCLGSSSR